MARQLVIRPEAQTDLVEAAAWYQQQSAGLGGEFFLAVEEAIDGLAGNPHLYPVRARYRNRDIRWFFPKRFPFRILYFINGPTITVFAIRHAKRHQSAWKQVLKKQT